MDDETQREAFEEWANKTRMIGYTGRHPADFADIEKRGQYIVLNSQVAWAAWQAATEHAKKN